MAWNTSTTCSIFKRSSTEYNAQKVPLRPRPSLNVKKEINVNKIKVVTLGTSFVTGISKWCSGRALSPSQPVANHQVRMWMWMYTPTNLQTTVMGPFPECCCHFSTFAIKAIRPAAGGSSFSFTHPLYWKIFIRRLFSGVWEYKSKSVFFFFFFFFFLSRMTRKIVVP